VANSSHFKIASAWVTLVGLRLLEGHFALSAIEQFVFGRHLGHQQQQRLPHLLRIQ